MKNKLKIIIFNIFLTILFLFILDFLIFATFYNPDKKFRINKTIINEYKHFYKREINEEGLYRLYILGKYNFYRLTRNIDSDKKPILLLGCSYTFNSHKIFDNTNRSSDIIAKYTNRPVYNRSRDGFGPPSILFQSQNEDFYKTIREPEFIIYTFIEDHVKRLYLPANFTLIDSYDILYKEKNGKLTRIKRNHFFKNICLSMYIKHLLYTQKIFPYNKSLEEKSDFFLKHMTQIKKNMESHWKNSKFIIFVYDSESPTIKYLENELTKEGFIVVYRDKITTFSESDKEYRISEYDNHPTPKAWEEITPKLIEAISND